MTEPKPHTYAELAWTAHDVKTLADKWTLEQCEEWLASNDHHIRDRLCELGWNVIENLLPADCKGHEEDS